MQKDHLTIALEVEGLKKPDRLLDCLAWLIVGPEMGRPYETRGILPVHPSEIVNGRWFGSALEKYPEDIDGTASRWRVPRFTASRDAAAMMIPDDVGHVLWNAIGKRPSTSMQVGGFWSEPSFGCNAACAMTAGGLRARDVIERVGHDIQDQDQLSAFERLWR